jgi:hypothetical protein
MSNAKRTSSYVDAVAEVAAIFARRDPLGLGGATRDLPANEYEAEAAEVVRRLSGRGIVTPDAAAVVIHGAFAEAFGAVDAGAEESYTVLAMEVVAVAQRHSLL